MPLIRILATVACATLLAACSPPFNWRPVTFGEQGASGVLPDKPEVQTRTVPFEAQPLALTMHSAKAGSVLFALGEAPLPATLAQDPQARERLAHSVILSFYRNAGVEPPAVLPVPGERFVIDGRGPRGALRFQVQVQVTTSEWLEAVVIAAPRDFARAPVNDFWLSLRWSARGETTNGGVSPQ